MKKIVLETWSAKYLCWQILVYDLQLKHVQVIGD